MFERMATHSTLRWRICVSTGTILGGTRLGKRLPILFFALRRLRGPTVSRGTTAPIYWTRLGPVGICKIVSVRTAAFVLRSSTRTRPSSKATVR